MKRGEDKMTKRTKLFDRKHLQSAYGLKAFCNGKHYKLDIYMKSVYVDKLDIQPTEFLYLKYDSSIENVVDYWKYSNDIKEEE